MAKTIQRPAPRAASKPAPVTSDPFDMQDDDDLALPGEEDDDGNAESDGETPHDLAIARDNRWLMTFTSKFTMSLADYQRMEEIYDAVTAARSAKSPILLEQYPSKVYMVQIRNATINKSGGLSVGVSENGKDVTKWLGGETILAFKTSKGVRMIYDPTKKQAGHDKGEFNGYLKLRDDWEEAGAESATPAAPAAHAKTGKKNPPTVSEEPELEPLEAEGSEDADGGDIDPATFLQCSLLEALIAIADSDLQGAVIQAVLDNIGEDDKVLYSAIVRALNANKPGK